MPNTVYWAAPKKKTRRAMHVQAYLGRLDLNYPADSPFQNSKATVLANCLRSMKMSDTTFRRNSNDTNLY